MFLKKVFKNLCSLLLFSSITILSSFSHSAEIQLQTGDFFFMKLNPDIAEFTDFITIDVDDNNEPLIYNLSFEESFFIQMDDAVPLRLTINVSANTLVLNTDGLNGETFSVTSENGDVNLSGLKTPNLFIFTTGFDNSPTIQLIRVNGENITFSGGDDPDTYIAPPQGIEVVISAGEAPEAVAPGFSQEGVGGSIPDHGNLYDDPIYPTPDPDTGGGCSLGSSFPISNFHLTWIGFSVLCFILAIKKARVD